jgi:hypothetical protein
MKFYDCTKEGMLTETGEKDPNKAQELLALADHKVAFWKAVEDKAPTYPSLFIEGNYEIIKELATAILCLDGWKADNHDCLFQYLVEKKQDLELDFDYLAELRKLRNKIDYHGIKVSYDTWKQNKLKIQIIIKTLKEYVKKQL